MAPGRGRRPRATRPPARARRRCSSGRSAGCPAILPCRSSTPPSGWVRTTQWAGSLNADDAELVALGQRRRRPQDRLLADVDLAHAADAASRRPAAVERVAVAGVHRARLVDDDDERDVGLLLAVADAHVDRQRLLERRLLVAAGAVAVRAADHHQALAEVAHVDLQRGQLRGRTAGSAARRRARCCRRSRARRSRSGAPRGRSCRPAGAALCSAATSSAATSSSPARTSVRGSPLTIVLESARSFWAERVARRPRRRRGTCGSRRRCGLTSNVTRVTPASSCTAAWRPRLAVGEEADRRRLGDGRADVGHGLDRLAEVRRRRRRQPLDEDLVGGAEPDQPRLDLGCRAWRRGRPRPGRRRSCRCRRTAARSASGRRRGTAPSRAAARAPMSVADVTGVEAIRSISREVRRQPLDEGLLAERHDARRRRPRGITLSVSRRKASASSRPALPTESDRSTTNTVASRSTGRTSRNPARARTSAVSSTVRTTSAAAAPAGADPPPRGEVAARPSGRAPGSAGAARAARRTDAHQAARRGARREPAAERRGGCG